MFCFTQFYHLDRSYYRYLHDIYTRYDSRTIERLHVALSHESFIAAVLVETFPANFFCLIADLQRLWWKCAVPAAVVIPKRVSTQKMF